MSVPDATAAVHALTEGLASMELRGMLAGDVAERVWRSSIASLVRGYDVRPRRSTSTARRRA